ncbi:MFS transporter [uncultured Cedecea sp.]|uniref:MFS transporter n=1 Tax=uncultured Cedecea sp. TaxID=988762 RepID=UPI0026252791|nr:MFS transporter [uncultured Cedecea sp.]
MNTNPTIPAESAAQTPSKKPLLGLVGILIAAIAAGLNNRVAALALTDLRGVLGFALDDASWLTTVYNVGELVVMPFAAWFAITLSVRRFELWLLTLCTVLAAILPFIQNINLLLVIRCLQGASSGAMIPVLMMAALKFLPPSIRLYGLALYAMTATFTPNISIWLAGYWIDYIADWRWIYWQIIPLTLFSGYLISIGLPNEDIKFDRFSQANWFGMFSGITAFSLIAIVLDQGVRLNWFYSPMISTFLFIGLIFFIIYLYTEWFHPTPFIKLQLLSRKNLWLSFSLFVVLLIILTSGSLLPVSYLAPLQGYRPMQMASIGLTVALPQLILGPLIAWLLSQKWMDARLVFSIGLLCISISCFLGMGINSVWNKDQFYFIQLLQAIGQPMAIISMLFLATSVVKPIEGPYVSGTINTLRALGSLAGGTMINQWIITRDIFHRNVLSDQAALQDNFHSLLSEPVILDQVIYQQSHVLSVADIYYVLGVVALILIPLVFQLTYIPAPNAQQPLKIASSNLKDD